MLNILRHTKLTNATKRFLHTTQQKHTGYIVLVPEIGEDAHAADGMLQPDGLPSFSHITIENCMGAIGQQAGALEKMVKEVEKEITEGKGHLDPHRVFHELDEVTGPLDTTWGIAKALYLGNSQLIPTKTYMNIHERARNARASKYNSRIMYQALVKQAEDDASAVEHRLFQKFLLEGKLNGLALTKDQPEFLKEIIINLGKERANFKNKVNMAVHTFTHSINDFQLVRDFPPTLLEAMARDPKRLDNGPWKITLQPQIVSGFLKYCPDRNQRWNVWQANARKASGQQEKSLENSTHLEKIRSLRKRQANLLGYTTYVDMSMETKMVGSVKNLKELFAQLLQHAKPAQFAEIEELQKFASGSGFEHKLDLYDVHYWQRKYLLSQHQIDEEALREYFPLPHVFSGLFSLSEKLFNIKIFERRDAQVWEAAVRYYDVFDCDAGTSSKPIGGFYIDCYSRENKFGKNNGWMVSMRNRNKAADLTPLCALIFNFTEPITDKPYLLNYDDLRLVFKTFGTAMQHLLTKATYTDLAGLSNIEWDASQVAGNVMSNFLDNADTLKSISKHYTNNEMLPDTIAQNTRLLKTHLAGYNLCQELYMADLDIELHQSKDFWLDIVKKLWSVYCCMPLDKKDAHPCSMTEIFSGDWAAAQFSHLYSKVIAADISEEFALANASDVAAVGKRFKDTFLASGGSVPSAEVFRKFRGRDLSTVPLLKSLDISKTAAH